MDCVHACATVIFLLLLAEPMLEKLDRIKVKYAGGVIQRPMDTHRKAGASVTDAPAFLWRPAESP